MSTAHVAIRVGDAQIEITITAAGAVEVQPSAGFHNGSQPVDVSSAQLTPAEERTAECLTEERQTAKAIAHRAGFGSPSGSFYAVMRALVQKGRAERVLGGGYRRRPGAPHADVTSERAEEEEPAPAIVRRAGIMDWKPSPNGHTKD